MINKSDILDDSYIDEAINLDGIYEQCNEHLREQDKKRDQLIVFYGAIIGIIVGNINELKTMSYIPLILTIFIVFSIVLGFIMLNYMKWHTLYNNSAITLQIIMGIREKEVNQKMIDKIFKEVSKKSKFKWSDYFKKTETKMLNLYLLVSSINFYLLFYTISEQFKNNILGIFIMILPSVMAVIYIYVLNSCAMKILKKIFRGEVDAPWCVNLYGNDKIQKIINESKGR